MKKLFGVLLLSVVAFMSASLTLVASEVSVYIDGVAVDFDGQSPIIVDDSTLVPVRGVFEHLGFDVEWNQEVQAVAMTRGSSEVFILIGSNTFITNSVVYTLDVPAQIINGRTMLPIRALLESAGYSVDWDATTSTVLINRSTWSPQTTRQIYIDVLLWYDYEHNSILRDAFRTFMDMYPNITIVISTINFLDYQNLLIVHMAAGALPDLARITGELWHELEPFGVFDEELSYLASTHPYFDFAVSNYISVPEVVKYLINFLLNN
ncbi:MAG: stalk domain-containing protein [Defluviitaleaceae bacterium]|nr:stalk domain-containing protein [Defluviitaleaceae bacterium]